MRLDAFHNTMMSNMMAGMVIDRMVSRVVWFVIVVPLEVSCAAVKKKPRKSF